MPLLVVASFDGQNVDRQPARQQDVL